MIQNNEKAKLIIKHFGFTQKQIAKEMNVNVSYVNRLLSVKLSKKNEIRIINALRELLRNDISSLNNVPTI